MSSHTGLRGGVRCDQGKYKVRGGGVSKVTSPSHRVPTSPLLPLSASTADTNLLNM
jgi:hypothetical protein